MSSTQSKYEIYLDEQKSILANKKIDLAEKQNNYDSSYAVIQQVQGLHRQRQEVLASLEDLATKEFENLDKFKLAKQQKQWFECVRSFPEFADLDLTPQERLVSIYQEMEQSIYETNQELNSKLTYLDEKISKFCSLEQYELWLREEEQQIEQLQEEIHDLESNIEGLEVTYQALLNQRAKEEQLQQNIDYIIDYWYEDSTAWINTFLKTEEGPHKNVPFSQERIDRLTQFLDDTLRNHNPFEIVAEEQRAVKKQEFITELRACFSIELITAFAHTLHLQLFPDNFFEGETGGFGLAKLSDGTLAYVGNTAWQVVDDVISSVDGDAAPQMCRDALERNDTTSRFYYSFRPRQEDDVSTTKQLCNLRRFLKDFWRFDNFYEFNINATLHVYPQKVEETAQKEAYRKYKQYMKDTGSYLLV